MKPIPHPHSRRHGFDFLHLPLRSALVVTAAIALGACSQQETQLAVLVDSFNAQIEEKSKELTEARAREDQLRSQVAEISGRLQEMETQLAEAKKAAKLTPESIAEKVLETLKPSIDGIAQKVASAAPSAPVPPSPQQSSSSSPREPIPTPRVNDGRVDGGTFFFP